ncbi:MAG TPA: hypothetical protein VKA54_02615 [Gemmatimonadaceae bacterium]|nr:hypothetical protein [Gemmatimonadaceae bacterium]
MIRRASIAAAALSLAALSSAGADPCVASRVDVADWPIVRSARVPGFTLRLPRSFTRDSATTDAPTARWSDASRARFEIAHRATEAKLTPFPSPDGRAAYARCEDRVGSATAIIISYGEGSAADTYVVHARIRWPDGEALEVHADAPDRSRLDELLAAVRTVRRAGA